MKRFYPYVALSFLLLTTGTSHADSLMDIYQKALENDPQLRADQAALEAGREEKNIGLSNLLPTINASVTYSDSESDVDNQGEVVFQGQSFPATSTESDETSRQVQVGLNQPLFNLSAWFAYKQGQVSTDIAEVQYKANQQAFIIRVAEAYFNVLRAKDTLETAQAEERALASQLEQTKQRYEVGLTAITDVHDAQAAYDGATATALEARGNLAVAFEALEVLTGEPHQSVAPILEEFPVQNPQPAERGEWVNMALTNNYSLIQAQLNADSAKVAANQQKSVHAPTLGASLTYNDTDSDSETLTIPGSGIPSESERLSETTTVSLRLDVPIFAGLGPSARRRAAHQQYLRSLELKTKAERDTVQSARTLHLNVETAVATVHAREQQIISSSSALEATQAGYEVGTRTLVDVLLAQRTLYQAQRNYYNSLYDYVIRTLRLKEAAGILSEQDIVNLNEWLDSNNPATRSELLQ